MRMTLFTALLASACTDDASEMLADESELPLDHELGSDPPLGKPYAIWNHEQVSRTSETSSQWWRSPSVSCSPGNALYGMGAVLPPANGNVEFRGMLVNDAYYPNAAEAAAQEGPQGLTSTWNMAVYALCGRPLENHRRAYGISPSGSTYDFKNATATCPQGTKVIGAGGTIYGANQRVKIDLIRPNIGLQSVTVFASEDEQGTSEGWQVQAIAICAVPPPGLELVAASIPAPSSEYWDGRELDAFCTGGKVLLSTAGGFEASNTKPLRVYNMFPSQYNAYTIVKGTRRGSVAGITGRLNAYAICADLY